MASTLGKHEREDDVSSTGKEDVSSTGEGPTKKQTRMIKLRIKIGRLNGSVKGIIIMTEPNKTVEDVRQAIIQRVKFTIGNMHDQNFESQGT